MQRKRCHKVVNIVTQRNLARVWLKYCPRASRGTPGKDVTARDDRLHVSDARQDAIRSETSASALALTICGVSPGL